MEKGKRREENKIDSLGLVSVRSLGRWLAAFALDLG
jgi:hypothetical protein